MKPPEYFAKALSGTLVAGRPMNINYLGGVPGAMAANSAGLNGLALTSYAGQIPIPAASGNTHLARFSGVSSAQGGILVLCDRLWHNSGLVVTTTGAQLLTSAAWPARDKNGSTNGVGVYIGLEIMTSTGAGAATPSIQYINDTGAGGAKTGSMQVTYAASSIAGTFYPFRLAAGDTGVRSISSCTLGVSMTSGSIALVAYRPLAMIELTAAGIPNAVDALTSGMPRLYDTSVPFILYIPQTTTTSLVTGSVVYTQG
jgi:hypothetical protein